MRCWPLLVVFCLVVPSLAAEEELVGPFPSWRDAQRDYGAVGDGRADDTPALQRALDDLARHEKSCVLYLPPGTYRLTAGLKTERKAHTDYQGIGIIGADPATVTLRWDGPAGGTMFALDMWYSKISRISFDGAGTAGVGLLYGPAFSTYNETSDLWFRDLKQGLTFGGPNTAGQAENAVLRCRFERCELGVQTVNWNSMDIWVWYSRFVDCGRAIHNQMGNWHAWCNVFERSKVSDLSITNLMAFSVVNNYSRGSRCFLDFSSGHSWGSPTSITGNRVIDCTGPFAMLLDNAGPYLVVDNQFRLSGSNRAVRMTWADQVFCGNRYSAENAVETRGRFRRVEEQVVAPAAIDDQPPTLPPPPPNRHRPVIEVAAGASAQAIAEAIARAEKLAGQRPVVHLPMGNYSIDQTIQLPTGSDLQLIGDSAGETGSRLNWTGPADGLALRVPSPAGATLRDFYLHAPTAQAMRIEGMAGRDRRVYLDQLNVSGPGQPRTPAAAALRVTNLFMGSVQCRALQGSGNGGHWVTVDGSPPSNFGPGEVAIYTGATGSAQGQYEVRDGHLVVRGVYHEKSADALTGLLLDSGGTLSIDATRFSYATSATKPTITVDGFRGRFTLATCMLLPVDSQDTCRIELRGNGKDGSVMALANQFWVHQPGTSADTVWQNHAAPPMRGGLLACNINTSNKEAAPKGWEYLANLGDNPDPARSAKGAGLLEDRGTISDQAIVAHLAPLRRAVVWSPADSRADLANVSVYRVMATGGAQSTVEIRH